MQFVIKENPTVMNTVEIKDLNDKKLGSLKLEWAVLDMETATDAMEALRDAADFFDGDINDDDRDMRTTPERLGEMHDLLMDAMLEHLESWNLTDAEKQLYAIDKDILTPLLNNADYFWPIWRDYEGLISHITLGVNVVEKMREQERKNSPPSGKRGNRRKPGKLRA